MSQEKKEKISLDQLQTDGLQITEAFHWGELETY